MIPCINKELFGFPCPGCGGQRAAIMVTQGDFIQAFWMYPAIYPLFCLALLVILQVFFPIKHNQKLVSIFASLSVGTILVSYTYKMINFL